MSDLISSVRIEPRGSQHAEIHVWNRGGKAGVLVVNAEDAQAVADRLRDHLPAYGQGKRCEDDLR